MIGVLKLAKPSGPRAGPSGPIAEPPGPTGVWPVLPAQVAEVLRTESPVSIAEISAAIQSEVAEYTRPFDASYARALGQAVQHAVDTFIERAAHPGTPMAAILAEFQGIGAVEAREGRSLEPLQAALRLGARVGWRRLCVIAAGQGLDALALGRAGEAIFVYLDELADASAQGYLEARAEFAGERERRRRYLLDLILADPAAPGQAVAEAARAAGWPLPAQVAAIALGDPHPAATPALPADVLADWSRPQPCLLVPGPDEPGRLAAVARALAGWPAAAGPAEPLARAAASLRWARRALDLAGRGIIDGPGPDGSGLVRCDEHLSSLMIFGDEELTRALCAARLAPLQALRPAQRDRLAGTLLIWLQHGCNANEVAARMHVHPQTVRYRLRQVGDLFGDQLRDPDRRFELEIALRARHMLTLRPATPERRPPGRG